MQQPFAAQQLREKRSCVKSSRVHCAAEKREEFFVKKPLTSAPPAGIITHVVRHEAEHLGV